VKNGMDWDKLRIFHAVAEAGSFTHAGESLNLSQSAVSRQVGALEESLGVALFHRHARGLILTEQGELLFRTAHDVFHKLAMAEAQLTDSRERPSGELKITTTVGFGSNWLTPRMREFIDLYPEIAVNLVLTDRELDLGMREADVAIRMWQPTQPDLVQRRLLTVHYRSYASGDYLKRYGTPQAAEDLDKHRLVVYGDSAPPPLSDVNYLMTAGAERPRRAVLQVNNVAGVLFALQSGLGVAALPDYMLPEESKLIPVLPDLKPPSFDTYFVYPEELRDSKRIAVFRDFLVKKVAESKF